MSSRVQVQTRTRPHKSTDGWYDPSALEIDGTSITARSGPLENAFSFAHCHGEESTQEGVFDAVKPIIENIFQGKNATVFVYGVTGSGKTHTMQGTPSDPGIIPRVVETIFARAQGVLGQSLTVEMSYVEILKDKVYDLLAETPWARELKIMDNGSNVLVVGDQIVEQVDSVEDFEYVYQSASKQRTTGATLLNSASSRSHAIVTLQVKILDNRGLILRQGKICLADLAGSENNNLTGNDRIRLQESKAINTSLTVLGKVVEAIVQNQSRIPYRDCKLTRLLSDALGGESACLLLCCLAPGSRFARETLNTLKFAARTMDIKSTMVGGACSSRAVKSGLGPPSKAPARRPLGLMYQAGSNLPQTASSWGKASMTGQKARPAIYADPTSGPSPLTESKAKLLFDKWYQSKREEELEAAAAVMPPLASSSQSFIAPAASSSDVETEKEIQARILLRDARKHQDSGDLSNAITRYEQARNYAPDNRKLLSRIAELKLEQQGRVANAEPASHLNPIKRPLVFTEVFGGPEPVDIEEEPKPKPKKRAKGVSFAESASVRMFVG